MSTEQNLDPPAAYHADAAAQNYARTYRRLKARIERERAHLIVLEEKYARRYGVPYPS